MELTLSLALPRDALSVPVARRVLCGSLESLGADEVTVSDIATALTEACANVLAHVQDDSDYEVRVGLRGSTVVIEVCDNGPGFVATDRGLSDAHVDAESGRGIQLMRALVDRLEFVQRPSAGNVVHLEKDIEWPDGSAVAQLAERA